MSLKLECEAAIYSYAPQSRQINSVLFGEYKEYVELVIESLRINYHALKEEGETGWSIPEDLKAQLDADKPY
jgi:hypothetical protein